MSSKLSKKVLLNGVPDDWKKLLDNILLDDVLENLSEEKVSRIVPPPEKIFEFARLTDLSNVKVIILGQDPYPKSGDAHGLAFSCMTGVPRSLKNIYKCLQKSKLIDDIPKSGDLSYWAKQGVLLLNCALTTTIGNAGEHMKYWTDYTHELITQLTKLKSGSGKNTYHKVCMLWGNFAKGKSDIIDDRCEIYEWSHPSPLARKSFTECDHFKRANKYFEKQGADVIDWNQEEPEDHVLIGFGMTKETKDVTVWFTDGSCYPNNTSAKSIGGYASVSALGPFKDSLITGKVDTSNERFATNNRAEGQAIWSTMKFLAEEKNSEQWAKCIFVCDTEFWIKMFNIYMPKWAEQDIDFATKKNPDMTEPMYDLYADLLDSGKDIEFRHIRSHKKDKWHTRSVDSYEYFCYHNNDYVDNCASWARKTKKLTNGNEQVTIVRYNEDE